MIELRPGPFQGADFPAMLRPTYTPEQFAAEALGGNRTAKWVRKMIRTKKIKATTRRPYLIPRSEAERFANPESP